MRFTTFSALLASLSTAAAYSQGFNYGATKSDGSFNQEADFTNYFNTAKNLPGTNGGFTSARLYTMIQGGSSTNQPTEAIPAAIKTGTSLLLGMWASAGQADFDAEMSALKAAVSQYGDDFAKLVVGVSVGSEDLYRNSPMGMAADAGTTAGNGADATTVASFITQLKAYLASTPSLSHVSVGHVDTWTAWAQSVDSNLTAVINACDWIGVDAYPYFQGTMDNPIADGASLFADALQQTQNAVGNKEIWITETGWPVSGKTVNQAVPNTQNAKAYWDAVGCPRFGNVNIFWFTLEDADPVTPNPSFGLISSSSSTPAYDLSCAGVSSSSASSSGSSTQTSSATGSATTGASSSVSSSVPGSTTVVISSGSSMITSVMPVSSTIVPVKTGSGSGSGSSSGTGSVPTSGSGSGNGNGSQTSSPALVTPTSVPVSGANTLSGSFVIGALSVMLAAVAAF